MISKFGIRSSRLAQTITPLRLIRHSSVAVQDVRPIPSSQKDAGALAQAHRIIVQNVNAPETVHVRTIDPFKLLAKDLERLREDLFSLVPSSQPELTAVARYYFESTGKHIRPLLILLFAKATNGLASGWDEKCGAVVNTDPDAINRPLSPPDILTDFNPALPALTDFSNPSPFSPHSWKRPRQQAAFHTLHAPLPSHTTILPTQRRLAQITEMIHVASLLHDDVIDKADSRRSRPSAPAKFGNKLSILGGDFLLARASAALARLGDLEVVELVSSMINNLVEGEVAQIEEVFGGGTMMGPALGTIGPDAARWNFYLKKTYLKTASLIAKSARASVVLGGTRPQNTDSRARLSDEQLKDIAYSYGRNIGIAFQLVDDMLDFSTTAELGKPSGGADMKLGLTTAPALFAWQEEPKMGELINRRFSGKGDVELVMAHKARSIVSSTSALEKTRDLAMAYANAARQTIRQLPETEARLGLETLCDRFVTRTK
ncbi:coq1 putative hexaprenyl diphosphate synthase [Ceratobasidium sp. 392]|nr:coq1 putative hexaprenyl diphosphate synthase [Ceratobasidium sp. 392]